MSQNSADTANDLNLLSDLVDKAKRAGADAADAVLFESVSLEVSYRLGAREDLERSESKDLGLRIFFGKKQAIVSSTDMTPASLDELLERGLAMAAAMPEDPYCGLADTDRLCTDIPDLDLNDPGEPTPEALYEMAAEAPAGAATALPWSPRTVFRVAMPRHPIRFSRPSSPAKAREWNVITILPPPGMAATWTNRRPSAPPPASGRCGV